MSDPERSATARRYALGIAVLQIGWVAMLFVPVFRLSFFVAGAVAEMAVPVWAEHAARTPWHPHHIAERYGLLTLIVLGESILAATMAVQASVAAGERVAVLAPIIVGGLLIVYSLWWLYFDRPAHDLLTTMRRAFVWGYGHYFVFAAAAAIGAGLGVAVEGAGSRDAVTPLTAGLSVTVPVAVYLVCLWTLLDRPDYGWMRALGPVSAIVVMAVTFTSQPVLWTGVTLAALVTVKLTLRAAARPGDP
jgi:low temperature requirement protein LtrA